MQKLYGFTLVLVCFSLSCSPMEESLLPDTVLVNGKIITVDANDTVVEAVQAAKELGFPVMVKAQIHAGGRGKAGGVKLARSPEEVEKVAGEILGKTLVTAQTGPEGKQVKKLLIEEGLNINKEIYVSFLVDRAVRLPECIASGAGGKEIGHLRLVQNCCIGGRLCHRTTLGSSAPYKRSTARLMVTYATAVRATIPCTISTSRA